jgi:hypothetical protein
MEDCAKARTTAPHGPTPAGQRMENKEEKRRTKRKEEKNTRTLQV